MAKKKPTLTSEQLLDMDQTVPSLRTILHAIASSYELKVDVIMGGSRLQEVSEARQVFCFLAYEMTSYTMTEIGIVISRCHTTVSHAIRVIEGLLKYDKTLQKRVGALRDVIEEPDVVPDPIIPESKPAAATPITLTDTASERERRLLGNQILSTLPPVQMTAVPRKRLSEELDEEMLLRFGYVPFVIAEVAWDYVDTVIDTAIYLRISETKKLVRRIKELRTEYQRLRKDVYYGGEQHEEDNMLVFIDTLRDDFSKMYQDGCRAIEQKHPGLDENYRMMVSCVYAAKIVFASMFRYVEEMKKQVEDFVRHKVGNIIPPQLNEINNLVIQFAGDCTLGDEFKETYESHVNNLVGHINSVTLYD